MARIVQLLQRLQCRPVVSSLCVHDFQEPVYTIRYQIWCWWCPGHSCDGHRPDGWIRCFQPNFWCVPSPAEFPEIPVLNQLTAVVNYVTSNLLRSPVSGLLGLAWGTLAASKAEPFWQSLAETNVFTEPVMAVHLTRYERHLSNVIPA